MLITLCRLSVSMSCRSKLKNCPWYLLLARVEVPPAATLQDCSLVCYSPLPKPKTTKIEEDKAKKDPVRSTGDEEKRLSLENPLKNLLDESFRKSRIFFSFPIFNLNYSIPLRNMVSVSLIHKLVITLSICLTNISTDRMVVDTRVCNKSI